MKPNAQITNEQQRDNRLAKLEEKLSADNDPMRTCLTHVLIACVLAILVLGFVSAYRNVKAEETSSLTSSPP